MKAVREDFVERPVFEFSEQASAEFFGVVAVAASGHAGDGVECVVQFLDAKANAARKLLIE